MSDARNVLIYHLSDGRQEEDLKGAVGPLAKWLLFLLRWNLPLRSAVSGGAPTKRPRKPRSGSTTELGRHGSGGG